MAIDPDGFGLACTHCNFIFANDITTGIAAAHFEAEHDTSEVRFELVVLCFRCETPMKLEWAEPVASGQRHHYACEKCHRTRVITQEPQS